MFTKWLRENVVAAGILAVVRVYLGWDWMTAGWEKLNKGFDAKAFLAGAAKKATGDHPAVQTWWAHFLNGFAIPNVGFFNFLVPVGEFLVGAALILGIFTTFAAVMGLVMNFAYLLSGTTSTNPQMAVFTIFIAVAAANAGKFGLDYYVLPYIRKLLAKNPTAAEAKAKV
ncbi:MAG: Crp/Fnr family transcriptional regulator [Paenibacillus sp. RIFOXYA1_FULL_44_5]|nr:MAG: Crp/Fnr family transcriptional regulator [Paenibacillus sp. RIFOXYA1_FULL_44_5]